MPTPYDEVADWYDAVVRDGTIVQDAAISVLLDLCADVRGRSVCDLACGQGIAARALARRGARVVGVDTSERLLEIARAEEAAHPLGIEFVAMDAQALEALAPSSFDAVVCNMALMDIESLPAVVSQVHRVLRPDGCFVFSVMHPCFQTSDSSWVEGGGSPGRLVRAYFREGRWWSHGDGMRARVGAVHRTLGSYINTFTNAGFVLQALAEPLIPREPGKAEPAYDVVPALLAARFHRT